MKKLLLMVTVFIFVASANAQYLSQGNASLGDLILGFENNGYGTKDLLIDLGQVTNSAFLASVDLNLNSDLDQVFGTNYAGNVSFGLYSMTSSGEIYASGPTNLPLGGYRLESAAAASAPGLNGNLTPGNYTQSYFSDLVSEFDIDGNVSGNGARGQLTVNGVYQNGGSTEPYAWSQLITPASACGNTAYGDSFNGGSYPSVENNIGNVEILYYQPIGSSSSYGTSDNLAFTVSSFGVLTVGAVPEPSTYALFGLGALVLIVVARRKTA